MQNFKIDSPSHTQVTNFYLAARLFILQLWLTCNNLILWYRLHQNNTNLQLIPCILYLKVCIRKFSHTFFSLSLCVSSQFVWIISFLFGIIYLIIDVRHAMQELVGRFFMRATSHGALLEEQWVQLTNRSWSTCEVFHQGGLVHCHLLCC